MAWEPVFGSDSQMGESPLLLAASDKQLNSNGNDMVTLAPEQAVAADAIFADGLTLFYDGAFKSALERFQKLQVDFHDTRFAYLAALCQYRMGEVDTARQAFIDLLEKDPNHHRARMALFELYAENGDNLAAARQARHLESSSMEEEYQILLDRLKMRRHQKPDKSRLYIAIAQGICWNSNINAGSDKTEVIAPDGTTYDLDEKDRAKGDWASTSHLYGWYRYDPKACPTLFWDSAVSIYHVHYFEHNEFNYSNMRLRTGPVWKRDAYLYSLPAGYRSAMVDGRIDSQDFFINPAVQYTINKRWAMRSTLYIGDRSYEDVEDTASDKRIRRIDLQPSFKFKGTMISVTAGLLDADAHDTHLSYRGVEAGLYARHRFTKQTSISVRYKHRVKNYRGTYTGWFDERQDVKNSAHASIVRKIGKNNTLGASISWSDNNSNTELFEYEKYTAGINVTLKF